jgi:DNA polymerase-3 subunit beta
MKIVLSRQDLQKGIQTILSAVPIKGTMPILSNVLLEARDTKLDLTATDLDVGIKCSIPAEIVDPGSITVNAKKLSDICRELPDASVDIETDENHRVILVCKKSQFKIHGMAKDDYPILPEVKKDNPLKLKALVLQEMIRKTIFAVSLDETRYVLNGVLFELTKDQMRMVATDGHRLAWVKKKADYTKLPENRSVIIPTKALNEVSRITADVFKGQEEEAVVEIFSTENQMKFLMGGVELVTRLLEGQFPNYEQVIPKETDKQATMSVPELTAATKRVSILASDKSYSIRFKIQKGKITISSKTPDMGEAKEDLDIQYEGEETTIAYNAKYVLDALKNLGNEQVELQFTQPLNPCIFKSKADADYLCVIMPMRI